MAEILGPGRGFVSGLHGAEGVEGVERLRRLDLVLVALLALATVAARRPPVVAVVVLQLKLHDVIEADNLGDRGMARHLAQHLCQESWQRSWPRCPYTGLQQRDTTAMLIFAHGFGHHGMAGHQAEHRDCGDERAHEPAGIACTCRT
jgi:hypothetical protein